MIVVDVNVLAYLFIDGPQTAEVQALREQDPEWAAPLLWRSEWRSIMTGYLRRGDLDRALALQMTETASRLLRGREYPVEQEAVLDVVLGSSLSASDAEYVATARRLVVPLYTYDGQILNTFPDVARRP